MTREELIDKAVCLAAQNSPANWDNKPVRVLMALDAFLCGESERDHDLICTAVRREYRYLRAMQ